MATVIAYAGLRPAPWKNGGGSTTEIAVWPPGTGLDDFDWRISVAAITADGPFSRFAGIERSLLLLEGDGVRLRIDGAAAIVLDAARPLLRFAGEAEVMAHVSMPVNSSTLDFNVMTRRASCRHTLTQLHGPQQLVRASAATLLFAAGGGPVTVSHGCRQFVLQRHDSLLLDDRDEDRWQLDAAASTAIVLVDIFPEA